MTPADPGKPYLGPGDGDAGLAALLQVADRSTPRSVKETILTCMLIRTVQRPKAPRRAAARSPSSPYLLGSQLRTTGMCGQSCFTWFTRCLAGSACTAPELCAWPVSCDLARLWGARSLHAL
jgi:hypothetical protein